MKIVDSGNKDKSVKFSELSCGDVFTIDGEVYMKTRYCSVGYAVVMKTGDIHEIRHWQDVTPLPNAELHLNK